MATQLLLSGVPVNVGRAFPAASYAGVAYGTSASGLGIAEPVVIAAGNSFTSDPIVVAGLTGFMCVFLPVGGGGNTNFDVIHCEPSTQVGFLTRSIAVGIVPGTSQSFPFGAYATGPALSDIFHTIKLKWSAVGAQQTISGIVLYGHAR